MYLNFDEVVAIIEQSDNPTAIIGVEMSGEYVRVKGLEVIQYHSPYKYKQIAVNFASSVVCDGNKYLTERVFENCHKKKTIRFKRLGVNNPHSPRD